MAQKTGQKFLNKYVEEWENNVEKGKQFIFKL